MTVLRWPLRSSAVQNISHARAVGQVQFACALKHRLPAVAKVFLRGTIDLRMVSIIIARTDNVEDAVMPALDEAIAAPCREVDETVRSPSCAIASISGCAKFDPAGVRIPPEVDDNRYVDVEARPARGWRGSPVICDAADAAALTQRLDALAATVCENDPRTQSPAPRRCVRGAGPRGGDAGVRVRIRGLPRGGAAQRCGRRGEAVIHVLAEQGTLDGASDDPGYLRGFRDPARRIGTRPGPHSHRDAQTAATSRRVWRRIQAIARGQEQGVHCGGVI